MNTMLKVAGGIGLAAAAMSYFGRNPNRDAATLAGRLGFGSGGAIGYVKGFGKGLFKGLKSAWRFRG